MVVEAEHALAAVPAVVCSVAGLHGAAAAATAAAAAADGRRRRGRAAPHAAPNAVAIVAVDQVGQTVQRLTSNEQLTHRRREGRDGLGGSAHDEITAAAHDSGEHQHRENRQAVDGEHQRAVKLREGAVRSGIGPAVGVDEDEVGEGDSEHGGAAGVLLTPPIGRDLWQRGEAGLVRFARHVRRDLVGSGRHAVCRDSEWRCVGELRGGRLRTGGVRAETSVNPAIHGLSSDSISPSGA